MYFCSAFFSGLLLLGNVAASPQFLDERGVAANKCTQDNLYRCFLTSSLSASGFCSTLTPFTTTVATVTASTITTTTTTVIGSTETDFITSIITTTFVVPATTTTVTVDEQGQLVPKRSVIAKAPLCLTAGTTYPASRITSVCSCIGVPALTVSSTVTASTVTSTSIETSVITTSTSTTTTTTAGETVNPTLTTTVTKEPAAPSAVITNGGFESGALLPWTIYDRRGGDAEDLVSPGEEGGYALKTSSSWYAQQNYGQNPGATFGQVLNTTPGVTYRISFDLHLDGGGGNYWSVRVNNGPPIAGGNEGYVGWKSYTGTFTAQTTTDRLNVQFYSIQWAYALFYWDKFVITPV